MTTILIAPGSRKISATAMAVDTGNERESTILTVPPLSCIGATFENANDRELSTSLFGLTGREEFPLAGGAKFIFRVYILVERQQAHCPGRCTTVLLVYAQKRLGNGIKWNWLNQAHDWKFFVSTSGYRHQYWEWNRVKEVEPYHPQVCVASSIHR